MTRNSRATSASDKADVGSSNKSVHAGITVRLHDRIPATGEFHGKNSITTVIDKGPGKAALVTSRREVFDQNGTTTAVVQVGSQQYTVAAGQQFATSYKVVSISGTCGQFLYGDSPFTLCQGEQVIK